MNTMNIQGWPSGFNVQPNETQTRGRGLAAADPQTRARVASAGGLAVSQDRKHMSEIGRLGGQHSRTKDRQEESGL